MKLDLEQEPFAPSGGIDGRAARRALGKPDLRFWDLFFRETLQNSWDARMPDVASISFSVSAVRFTEEQALVIRDEVFPAVPPSLAAFVARLDSLPGEAIVVSDRRTRGLAGATRADMAAEPGESRDFVDFLRNVGRAPTKTLGGGTYGFGKGVLYDASQIDTCIVYSQTIVEGALTNRLIATSVGEQFEMDERRYTGRHWWGVASQDSVVEPLTGQEARLLAERIGLARLDPSETGTEICVLDPRLAEDEDLPIVIEQIADAADRWAWPHMVDLGAGPTVQFEFEVFGERIERQPPSDNPILQHYVRAYERAVSALDEVGEASSQWPWTSKKVALLKPVKELGVLTYRKFNIDEEVRDSALLHHVALMRKPRFIVKYLAVAEDSAGQGTAGVFIVRDELNDDFAKAEPVAHDDWIPTGGRSNPVKVALTKIVAEFKNVPLERPTGSGMEHASGVAQISRMLGSILAGSSGPGGEVPKGRLAKPGGNGGGGSRSGVSAVIASEPQLVAHGSQIFADFYFTINASVGIDLADYLLEATAKVLLDGGALEDADDRPAGSDFPELVGWYSDGVLVSKDSEIPAIQMSGSSLVLRVRQPLATAISAVIQTRSRS